MEMDPLDRDIDGAPHFYAVPATWLPHLGRLAVVSARIEKLAHDIASELDLPVPSNGRTNPLSQQCRAIVKRLRDPWRPNWIDADLPEWAPAAIEWAEKTPDIVDETRNLYVHGQYAYSFSAEGESIPVMLDRREPRGHVAVDDAMLRMAIERLVPLDRYGFRIYWTIYRHRHPLTGDGPMLVAEDHVTDEQT